MGLNQTDGAAMRSQREAEDVSRPLCSLSCAVIFGELVSRAHLEMSPFP